MPMVVIAGPNFIGTSGALARGFNSHGWESAVYTWGGLKPNVINRIWKKILGGKIEQSVLERRFNRLLKDGVIPLTQSAAPDLVVLIKPQRVADENVEGLKRLCCPLITWATDSLDRFPGQKSLHEICEKTYVMDGGDVESPASSWMPLGYDDQVFRPSTGPKTLDVLFVGNVFRENYSTRRFVFEALRHSSLGERVRVGFVGSSPISFYNNVQWMPGPVQWVSRHLPIAELALLVAKSRVCVNIHQDDGLQPVNPMFFAIPGCKVCQVTDDREYLQHWLRADSDFVALKPDELIAGLDKLLNDERKIARIAQSGFEKVKEHTYTARARQILNDLSTSN